MCWDKLAVVGQLVLVILEQIQRAQPSLSRALCLCSFSRLISQPVCLVLASEPTRNLLCVVTQHECVLPAPSGDAGDTEGLDGALSVTAPAKEGEQRRNKSQVEVTAFFRPSDAVGNTGLLLPFGKGSKMCYFPPD